ncbi:fasciclin-2-like isoform X2 [Mercenaria mercenaria]|uniref:fasciclin-2-like isoform X2 n=1 Tax=Mercenaria mercenaria TaxID=6596 RepID=UPI00234F95EB|nr:fasciclin-2-like isoform X2 [Mercenaria mercenaria]
MGIKLLYIIPLMLVQTVYGGIEFNVQENPLKCLTGNLINVICSLTANEEHQNAKLQWIDKNDNPVLSTSLSKVPYIKDLGATGVMLSLGTCSDETAGTYKCQAVVDGTVVFENEIRIKHIALLTLTNCELEQWGILGQESQIECTAQPSGVIVFWDRDPPLGNNSDNEYVKSPTSLRIKNTKMSDAGTYTYTAVQKEGAQTEVRNIKFDVYTAPTIVGPILQTTAIVGRSATLYCKARGIPDPEIEWKKQGSANALRTTDRIIVSKRKEGEDIQGILNFTSVVKEDEGFYTCTAQNIASSKESVEEAKTEDKLTVQIPPTIEKISGGKGKEGGPANLECIARGDPIPEMIWFNVKTGERLSVGTAGKDISVTKEDLTEPSNLGARLTVKFDKLKHSDAGEYKCVATNKADTAEAIVNLEVQYKPNFNDQGPTTFYNWYVEGEDKDNYLTCIANGNPLPSFTWYKGDAEITPGYPQHSVVNEETDPENPHRAVSKLYVTYTGQNGDNVFGEYRCVAANLQGRSEITLTMEQAKPPGEPIVSAQDEDATFIDFWLEGPVVRGPEVTEYKVIYKVKGSPDEPKELTVQKEYRDHIDTSRKYTVLTVRDLLPSTEYVFTFYATNAVGTGPGREFPKTTKAVSVPDKPEITTQSNSPQQTRILVQWTVPSNGGAAILEYKLTYQRVNVNKTFDSTKGYEVLNKVSSESTITGIKDPSYTIRDLLPGTYYQIKVSARNREGFSVADRKVIRTQTGPRYDQDTSGGVSRWEPVKVSMTMFGCLVAICACLKRLM